MKDKYNILFYTTSQPIPTVGGVERATITTATLLRNRGHGVYSIYRGVRTHNSSVFDDECCFKMLTAEQQIYNFVREKEIDIIIIQSVFGMVKVFKKAIAAFPCKIVTVYHFEPIWDKHFVNFNKSCAHFIAQKSLSEFLRLVGYPVLKSSHLIRCHRSFRQGYRLSDRIVLLSDGYKSEFLKYVGDKTDDKISVVPNALPSEIPNDCYQPSQKENIVLIVARLDEEQKRISMALELWRDINSCEVAKDWSMIIVGDGDSRRQYENYIKKHCLKNVTMVGKQVPWDYYKRASIFMMTSRSEGWGITLLEAQKFGVVPVCFNTFAAASDVVSDKCSGFLIDERDKQGYIKAVLALMSDVELRDKMAQAGIEYVQRFSQDSVADKWDSLLYSVMNAN